MLTLKLVHANEYVIARKGDDVSIASAEEIIESGKTPEELFKHSDSIILVGKAFVCNICGSHSGHKVTYYKCRICHHKHPTEEEAVECQARKTPPFKFNINQGVTVELWPSKKRVFGKIIDRRYQLKGDEHKAEYKVSKGEHRTHWHNEEKISLK